MLLKRVIKAVVAIVAVALIITSCSRSEELAVGDSTIAIVIPPDLNVAAQSFTIDLSGKESWKLGITVRNNSYNNHTVSVGVDELAMPAKGLVQTGNYDKVCPSCDGLVVVSLAAGHYSVFVDGQPTKAKIVVTGSQTPITASAK